MAVAWVGERGHHRGRGHPTSGGPVHRGGSTVKGAVIRSEYYVRISDEEPVEVVRYDGDPEALRAWGGPAVTVADRPPGVFVGVTEIFVGNRVVRDGEGRLEVPRTYDFHSRYRRQPVG